MFVSVGHSMEVRLRVLGSEIIYSPIHACARPFPLFRAIKYRDRDVVAAASQSKSDQGYLLHHLHARNRSKE